MKNRRFSAVMQWMALPLAAILLAWACQTLRPSGAIAWVYDWSHHVESRALEEGIRLIDVQGVRAAIQSGEWMLLDARPREDYEEGHLPGALCMPYDDVDEAYFELAGLFAPEQPLIAYCSGEACDESFNLILFLREQGLTNAVLFAEGVQAWEAGKLPLEEGAAW